MRRRYSAGPDRILPSRDLGLGSSPAHLHTRILTHLHARAHAVHTCTLALAYFYITLLHTCIFLHHYSCTSMQHDAYFHKCIFAILKTFKTFYICSNSTPFLSLLPISRLSDVGPGSQVDLGGPKESGGPGSTQGLRWTWVDPGSQVDQPDGPTGTTSAHFAFL